MPDAQLSILVRSFLVPERLISMNDLTSVVPSKEPFQLVVKMEDSQGRRLLVILGPDLPSPDPVGDDESEEDLVPGNIITAEAATSDDANRLADLALKIFRRGMPRWGRLKEKGHMNILRLDNLAALALVAVGFIASVIVDWPVGLFFGLFVGLVLLLVGVEIVESLFPPFDLHEGRPRWRTRWPSVCLLVGIPFAVAVVLRILLGPWR
jgi:hypothetical protein